MSLLMKALEKAAKDRDDARAEPVEAAPAAVPVAAPAAAPGPRSELSLEPLAAQPSPAPAARPESSARPATPSRSAAAAPQREQQAQAATVLQAAGPGRKSAGAYVQEHPIIIIGVLAALIAIGYGTYVYLQVFHPALLQPQRPIAPKAPASPLAQAPVPGGVPPSPAVPGAPLPSGPLLQAEAPDFAPPPPPPPAPPRAPEKPAVEAAPPPAPAPRDTIKVSRGSATAAVNPLLTDAYAALQADRREDAQRVYEELLRAEPRNIDALLGLAAIAATEGRSDEATRRYVQILELDPRHALAQSGLIGLLGRADPLAAESRLKQLIAREPSAFLYFTLGNLYADQSLWAQAQHAYFQAHHLEPGNPDYAYNLAVGLEHVSQGKLALGYYRRAVELAAAPGRAHFNVAQAQERIGKLASQVE